MERLTFKLGEQNPSYGLVDKASAKPGLFTDYDGFYAHLLANHRLGQYEDTGLTPEEITDHEAIFKAYRNVCGGKSPDEISALIVERDTLKKALEKYQKTEQWLNDMNNPLEPIKVSAALDSEIMKLNYRKEHNPESISELDGTIISALLFIQQAQEQEGQK